MVRPPLSRDDIVARARDLLREQGVEGTSFRSVARSLGVTAPALYAHVEGYGALLAAVAADEFRRLTEAFRSVDGPDPVERMRRMGRTYVDHARAEPQLHRLMFRFPPALPTVGVGAPVPAFEPATELFEAAMTPVRDAAAAGRLRPVDPFVAALALWSAAHGVAEVLLMGFDFPDDVADGLVTDAIDAAVDHLLAPSP